MLKLWFASQSANPSRIAKLVDDISGVAGLNTHIPHLKGRKVFGSAKCKLDFPSGDENDSDHHDCVNYSVAKLSKRASSSQCWRLLSLPTTRDSCGSSQAPLHKQGLFKPRINCPLLNLLMQMSYLRESSASCLHPLTFVGGKEQTRQSANAKIAKY